MSIGTKQKQSGYDPRRRNRNIGTPRQGHGQDNRLVIPRGFSDDRIFWEKLDGAIPVPRNVNGHELVFLVEPIKKGFVHACTVDDICAVLEMLPRDHIEGIELILLRQPKRKERILSSVWGRFLYYAAPGRYSGTAICLESQMPDGELRLSISQPPEGIKEIDRLEDDGHRVTRTKRHFIINGSLEQIRATQLYRTLIHEVGHYVDWLENALRPLYATDDDEESDRIREAFDSKPSSEKEAFAHRYADHHRKELTENGHLPFGRMFNTDRLMADGLDPSWFSDLHMG